MQRYVSLISGRGAPILASSGHGVHIGEKSPPMTPDSQGGGYYSSVEAQPAPRPPPTLLVVLNPKRTAIFGSAYLDPQPQLPTVREPQRFYRRRWRSIGVNIDVVREHWVLASSALVRIR